MQKITDYKQLTVWQKSMDLVVLIYKICEELPKNQAFILCAQIQRAVISIPSNIAEGFRRSSQKEKKQFYSIAYASGAETETQLEIIARLYPTINITEAKDLITEIQKMLNALIRVF